MQQFKWQSFKVAFIIIQMEYALKIIFITYASFRLTDYSIPLVDYIWCVSFET